MTWLERLKELIAEAQTTPSLSFDEVIADISFNSVPPITIDELLRELPPTKEGQEQ